MHGKWTETALITKRQPDDSKDDENDDVSKEKGIRLQKYVGQYLGDEYDAEIAFNDIYHIQQ